MRIEDDMTEARPTLRGLRGDDYRALGRGVLKGMKEDDVASLAAGVAFRIFLSLFPTLFAAVAVFTVVSSGQDIVRLLESLDFVPAQIKAEIEDPLVRFVQETRDAASLTIALGVAGGLWAASSAAVMLAKALTRIFGSAETRTFLRLRLVGLLIAVALFVALVALVVLLVLGPIIQGLVVDLPVVTDDVEGLVSAGLSVSRYLLAVLVVVVLFAFVYWAAPDRDARPAFMWFTPGAVLGVGGWILLTGAFGLYTRSVGDNELYGALGGIIVLLLWLQISMIVLLVGAVLNSDLRRVHAARIVHAGREREGHDRQDGHDGSP